MNDEFLLVFMLVCAGLAGICGLLLGYGKLEELIDDRKRDREILERKQELERIRRIHNEQALEGTMDFPSEKYYLLCKKANATQLDNEFSIQKAKLIAEQLIKEVAPDVELSNCGKYLSVEGLKALLTEGERLNNEAEQKKILEQKQPRDAKPTEVEKTFIQRASDLSGVSGCNKRVEMLSNLIDEYSERIRAKRDGEEALRTLGMIYASQQQKETSWAVMGGIAEGIAGPAAGIMAAANTMENNQRIREYNESMRRTSMEIMCGIPSLAGDRHQLEKEQDKLYLQRSEARGKVVLTKPAGDEIWQNIRAGKATVKKNSSGVLRVSVPVTLKAPFVLDVPDGVSMVVDGTIKGEVWFEEKLVGDVLFPLPLYGIFSNMTEEVTLDGMCGRCVEYNGEYTVKLADTQNLWIMEA